MKNYEIVVITDINEGFSNMKDDVHRRKYVLLVSILQIIYNNKIDKRF